MYYWSETVSATSLEKEFLSFGGIREIYIGTAFFSAEGLRILRDLVEKNNLKRSKIHIFSLGTLTNILGECVVITN